jgi:hypothetical protein
MGAQVPRLLGLGGLLPFIVLAGAVVLDGLGWRQEAAAGLLIYGALILSFVGGVTWGNALRQENGMPFLLSMAPFFAALVALYLPVRAGLWLLIAAFGAAYFIDRGAARRGEVPGWFRRLRGQLTAVVMLSLLVAVASV